MSAGIYVIKNNLNGNKYIGYSYNIKARWAKHKNALRKNIHANRYLQNAWNKYGEENFSFYIIFCFFRIKEILSFLEKVFIFLLRSYYEYGKGYNQTKGGEGYHLYGKPSPLLGKRRSLKTKRKMRKITQIFLEKIIQCLVHIG